MRIAPEEIVEAARQERRELATIIAALRLAERSLTSLSPQAIFETKFTIRIFVTS